MKEIKLTRGKVALVDEADYEWLSQWKWCVSHGYAFRGQRVVMSNGKYKFQGIYMHRLLLDTPTGTLTDHINGNKLDNRRSNLRLCTAAQNAINAKPRQGSSQYKGVYWNKAANKWRARLQTNNDYKYLGQFTCEAAAARAYNEAAIKHHGEFARLNIILQRVT